MRHLPPATPEEARRDHWQMIAYLAGHAAFGVALGAAIGLALVWLDIGGAGTRLARAQNPLFAGLIMIVPLALTFGGAVAASSIMLLPYRRKYREPPKAPTEDEE